MTEIDSYGDRHEFESVGGASAATPALDEYIDIVFDQVAIDGAPHEYSFIEVENSQRASIKFGEWVHRDDGYWVLRILSANQLDRIRAHVANYHLALDNREHGGIAQHMAFDAICKELGTYWTQGEEAKRRAAQTKTEPQ